MIRKISWSFAALLLGICGAAAGEPTASSALPDWSGLWQLDGIGVGPSGALFYTPEGLAHRKELEQGPYNDTWQPKLQAYLAARDRSPADPEACDTHFPDIMIRAPIMFLALVTPKMTALVFAGRQLRQIHTDSSAHPAAGTLFPTPWGDSIGHWESGTLVIDTIGVDNISANPRETRATDLPQSEQVHYLERLRLIDKSTLEDQMTIEDPIAFTHPWKLTRLYKRVADLDRMPMKICFAPDFQQTK